MGTGKPSPLALIICDTVIDDRETHKKTLVGTFDTIGVSKVPSLHHQLHVFVSLANGNGVYQTRLECRHRENHTKVFEVKAPITFGNPNQVVEINFALRGIVFQQFGIYNFDFYCDEQFIVTRAFTVAKKQSYNDG